MRTKKLVAMCEAVMSFQDARKMHLVESGHWRDKPKRHFVVDTYKHTKAGDIFQVNCYNGFPIYKVPYLQKLSNWVLVEKWEPSETCVRYYFKRI